MSTTFNTIKLAAVKLHKRVTELQTAATDLDYWMRWNPCYFDDEPGTLCQDGVTCYQVGVQIKNLGARSEFGIALLRELEPELNAAIKQILARYAERLHAHLSSELTKTIQADARLREPLPNRKLALHNDEKLALCET